MVARSVLALLRGRVSPRRRSLRPRCCVVVVLAGAGLTSFGPPVPEPKFESYSIHEPLRRELVPPFSPRARPLAPLALAPLALLAVLTLASPALRLSLRCHVGKLEERIVDKGISSSAEALLSLSSTPSSSVWLARGYTQ